MSVFNMGFASKTQPVDAPKTQPVDAPKTQPVDRSPVDTDPTAPGNMMWTETEDEPSSG